MKKTLIALSILGTIGFTSANYNIQVPLEQTKGGSLPNGSIIFTNQAPAENWVATTPIYTDWVNFGELTNCTNWTPNPNTVAIGETFTQTASDCQQQQSRTRQDLEIETNTSATRNVGEEVIENQTIAATDKRETEGTGTPWDIFADARGLSKTWNNLTWMSANLTEVPSSPYPLTSVTSLNLQSNQLTNVDGLSNLTSVTTLNLAANKLTNVDGLSNLTSVNTLNLNDNPLTNINGLANVIVGVNIRIDGYYSGSKLAATTRFCSLNAPEKFPAGSAQKSRLCQ